MSALAYLSLLLLVTHPAAAQNCPLSSLETLPDVVAPCCEAMPGGTCAEGFPSICPQICAEGLVAFWDDCDETVGIFPDDYFDDFRISGVREIVQSCRQVCKCKVANWHDLRGRH